MVCRFSAAVHRVISILILCIVRNDVLIRHGIVYTIYFKLYLTSIFHAIVVGF